MIVGMYSLTILESEMNAKRRIHNVLNSQSVSFWLKNALTAALKRDCVDACHDAQMLARLLTERADEIRRH